MFTRKTIPFIIGSILLVSVAFLFLTRDLNWNYVSELYKDKDEPAVVINPPQQSQPEIKLDIAVSLNEQQYEELLAVSKQAKEQYPQLDIVITNYFEEQLSYAEWEKLARLGKLGDIQLVPNEWVVPLAIQGLYQPVDRLLSNEVLSDQLPSIADALKWNGYLWALPYESNPYLVFIHKDATELLEKMNKEEADLIDNIADHEYENDEMDDKAEADPLSDSEQHNHSEQKSDEEAASEENVAEGTATALDDHIDSTPEEASDDTLQQSSDDEKLEEENVTSAILSRLSFNANITSGQLRNEGAAIFIEADQLTQEAASETALLSPLEEWSLQKWLQLYEQLPDFSGALLNIDGDQYSSLLIWLSLWHGAKDEYMELGRLTKQQLELLQYMELNPDHIMTSAELSEGNTGAMPLLYLASTRYYFEQRELILDYYLPYQARAPLPWMNGKSFMLSSSAFGNGKNDAAMQWMEWVNRSQPEHTLSHRKLYYVTSSNSVQSVLGTQFQQKLSNNQLFHIDRHWMSTYEELQQHWKRRADLQQKLALLLESSQ